ncbi:MAG: colicin production protein, partial [Caulobacteraceae bacterium]|nr:colicin production protein [Caulobacteraceae bacterium]
PALSPRSGERRSASPVNAFDIFAGILFAIAMVMGLAQGAVRGLVGMASLVLAAFVGLRALPLTAPMARNLVHQDWAVVPLGVAIGFGASYIVFRLIGGALAKGVRDTPGLGGLDRLVGAGFGFVQVVLILGVINIGFSAVSRTGGDPQWVTDSVIYPLTEASARLLRALAPQAKELAASLSADLAKSGDTAYDGKTTTRRIPAR